MKRLDDLQSTLDAKLASAEKPDLSTLSPERSIKYFNAFTVALHTGYASLINAISDGLGKPIQSPLRTHLTPNDDESSVLIMPAWRPNDLMGVKIVSIWPQNNAVGKSAVAAIYVALSCRDGAPLAVIDGTELTLRRTAATAALAARLLTRSTYPKLAILGTGALSPHLALAHCSAMKFSEVCIWGRNSAKAEEVVAQLLEKGIAAVVHPDLQTVLADADVIAAATTATSPFIKTSWIMPGAHVGLIGAYTPAMAEAEPTLIKKSRLYVDSRLGVLEKGGEVVQALAQGLINPEHIVADLGELIANPNLASHFRTGEITVFKSVGFAALDLIAAELVLESGLAS